MANKLKTKPTNTNRYFKGLSLNEMDDVEQSVEYALEDPGGTFSMVSKEHSFKLSALSKTVKSISGDTKYIRKTIDKMNKKMDDLQYSSGSGNSPLVNTAAAAAVAAALRSIAASVAGLYATEVAKKIAINEIDKLRPSDKAGQKLPETVPVFKIGGGLGTELAQRAAQVAQEWLTKGVKKVWSGSDAGPSKSNTQIPSFLNLKGNTPSHRSRLPAVKAPGRQSKAPAMNMNVALAQFNTHAPLPERSRGFKELTPTERAQEIAKRLKGMSQLPGIMDGGFAPGGTGSVGIPNARGSLGRGTGRPNYPPGSTGGFPGKGGQVAPGAPSAYVSTGAEGTRDGGRVPGKPAGVKPGIMTMEEQMAYIQKAAIARGVDPNVALTIAKREGLKGNGNNQAGDMSTNLGEYTSFGPYQLHYGYKRKPGQSKDGMSNYGLGDEFTKKTGLDARDPTTVRQQIDFALDHMATVGHSKDWHGFPNATFPNAKAIGVTPYAVAEVPAGASAISVARTQTAAIDSKSFVDQGGGVRNLPIPDHVKEKMIYAQEKAGIAKVVSVSSGQIPWAEAEAMGARVDRKKNWVLPNGKIVGKGAKNRHSIDVGAGDLQFQDANGKLLRIDDPKVVNYMKYAAAAGLKGIGAGHDYMKDYTVHIGGGEEGSWGGEDHTIDKQLAAANEMGDADFLAWKQKKNETAIAAAEKPTAPSAIIPAPATQLGLADMSGFSNKKAAAGKITSDTAEVNNLRHRPSFSGEGRPQKFNVREDGEGTVAGTIAANKSTVGLSEKAKSYAMYDDISNPSRAFPTIKKKAPLPLTPGAEGKSDKIMPQTTEEIRKEHEEIKKRNRKALQSDPNSPSNNWRQVLDGTVKAPTFFPKVPDGARENLVPQIQRPVAAAVTPEKDWNQTIIDGANATAQAAMDAAQNATKSVYDWMAGQKAAAPAAANRIPLASKNPPPLTNPPRTYHRATQTTNPTAKTPGSDSSKSFGTTTESEAAWQYPAIEMGVP